MIGANGSHNAVLHGVPGPVRYSCFEKSVLALAAFVAVAAMQLSGRLDAGKRQLEGQACAHSHHVGLVQGSKGALNGQRVIEPEA